MKIQDIVNEQPPVVKPRIKLKPTAPGPSAWAKTKQTAKDLGTAAGKLGTKGMSWAGTGADWLTQIVTGNVKPSMKSPPPVERKAVSLISDPVNLMNAWNMFVRTGSPVPPALEKTLRDILAAIEKSKRP
jgi:hypothetical protein